MRCIFDEEDERVLLCQILVPLVPKMYKETDSRYYGSKQEPEGKKNEKKEEREGEGGRQRKTRWKMWSRKRGLEGESERRGAETEKKGGGMSHR